eukprot:gene575-8085_t
MQNDERIVALIKKNDIQRIRKKREKYKKYQQEQKISMIQFLITIFIHPLTNVLKTKFGNFPLLEYSIFEGIKSRDVPSIEDFQVE